MKKAPLRAAILAPAAAIATGVAIVLGGSMDGGEAQCGPGFVAQGARCLGRGPACPAPLASTEHGCDALPTRVAIPESTVLVGPSDWEAEGRVAARTIHVAAFAIDAFEITIGT